MGVVATVAVEMKFPTTAFPLTLSPSAWWRSVDLTLSNGDPVGSWTDASGNGRTLTAAGAARPTYTTETVRGQPRKFVRFDGTDDVMTSTATLAQIFGASGVSTIMVIYRERGGQNGILFTDTTPAAQLRIDVDASPTVPRMLVSQNDDGGGVDEAETETTLGVWHGALRMKDSDGVFAGEDNWAINKNLIEAASGATSPLTGTVSIGGGGGGAFFYGDIADIIVFPTLLSQANRLKMALYFSILHEMTTLTTTGAIASDVTTFVDITSDILAADSIQFHYGMNSNSQRDRVASTGVLSFSLVNSEANSAGLAGYYSPEHANARAGFDFGIETRVKITYGGTDYYKFRGVIDEIVPTPGKAGRVARITCVDWMDEAARTKLSGLAVQLDQRADQVFSTILAGVLRQPAATSIDTTTDVFPVALDNTRDEGASVLSEFQKLASSELGYIFVKGDTTQGGTLVFEGRGVRGADLTNDVTFGDSTLWGVSAGRRRDDITNLVKVTLRPRRIDTSATTVLASIISATNPLFLARNAVYPSFIIAYRDPSQPAVRAGGTEMVSPVATTDYQFNAASDGTGTDLTSQLTVTATFGGNSVVVDVLNNGPQDGYLTKLQVRGKGVYSYEPVTIIAEDEVSQAKYGENVFQFEMPYQGNLEVGLEAASYLLARGKNPLTQVDQMQFLANDSNALMTQALTREISDRIGLAETTTGIDYDDSPRGFFINGVSFVIHERMIRCAWTLIPTDHEAYWILEDATFGVLNSTTRLAFGIFT